MWLIAAINLGFQRHNPHDVDYFCEVLLVGAVLAGSVAARAAGRWNAVAVLATAAVVTAHLMA
jgi:hypothetical protein